VKETKKLFRREKRDQYGYRKKCRQGKADKKKAGRRKGRDDSEKKKPNRQAIK